MTEPALIVFYSRSGNTRSIAHLIHQEVGGTLHELQPVAAYPPAYNTVVEQAKREIRANYHPALRSMPENVEACATLFVGSPNWWDSLAPPVGTFLAAYDFAEKAIAPFCTHGGGGMGDIPQDIARLCPGATVLDCLALYGSGGGTAPTAVFAWLRRIGLR